MIKVLIRLSLVLILSSLIAWLVDVPGKIIIDWQDMRIETSIAIAVAGLSIGFILIQIALKIIHLIGAMPKSTKTFLSNRREKLGYQAVAKGFVALGSGDLSLAGRYLQQSKKTIPSETLTQLLELQVSQSLHNDDKTAEILAKLSVHPKTALLGLAGLHREAVQQGNFEAAGNFANQALRSNPSLQWASDSLIKIRAGSGDWDEVLSLLDNQQKFHIHDSLNIKKRKAVALTAKAIVAGAGNPSLAFELAKRALSMDSALIPAATQLCQSCQQLGKWQKAQRYVEKCFSLSPHAGLAEAYARLQLSASPQERLRRVQHLRKITDGGVEGAFAEAKMALAAREFDHAIEVLKDYESPLQARIAGLYAAIFEAQDQPGKSREWLARALTANRDPQWTADTYVSDNWLPLSPVTGEIGAFEWKVPISQLGEISPLPKAPPSKVPEIIINDDSPAYLPDDPGIETYKI